MGAAGLTAALLSACGMNSSGFHTMLEVDSSSGKAQTADFIPPGAWDVQYTWDCSHQQQEKKAGADGATVEVWDMADDTLAAEHPQTVRKGRTGKGTLHFERTGDYYLTVTSVCDWHLTVDDLSQT